MKDKKLHLPKATNGDKKKLPIEETFEVKKAYPCPCCGYYTLISH